MLRLLSPDRACGVLDYGPFRFRCAIGPAGVRALKREGDGATPAGCWPLRYVLYRPDRVARPRTRLQARSLEPDDGWCDDVGDRNYNRPVRLPYPASTESLWREDGIYDIVVPLGFNDTPRTRGRGSAIFLHLARPDYAATAGCLALSLADLLRLLARPPASILTAP